MARGRQDYESFLKAERTEPPGGDQAQADDGELASTSPGLSASPSDPLLMHIRLAYCPDYVLVQPIPERGESYAFSVALSSVFSIIVYPPSLTKWYGSVTVNLIGGQTLPTMHFHDDESASTMSLLSHPRNSTSPPSPTWGGEDFLQRLRTYAHLLRSQLEPNLYLVNPNREDMELHSTTVFDESVDDIFSPIPAHQRPQPAASTSSYPSTSRTPTPTFPAPSLIHNPRTSILSTFGQITRAATSISNSILFHPSVSPHLPAPVRSLVHADTPTFTRWSNLAGAGEYDSARVYLARWARLVAEEGERAKRAEISGVEGVRNGDGIGGDLGVWEVLRVTNGLGQEKSTREKGRPVGRREWDDWFDHLGAPLVDESHMRAEVFKRVRPCPCLKVDRIGADRHVCFQGLDPSLRSTAWPFLLSVISWKTTLAERTELWSRKRFVPSFPRTD